MIYLRVRSLELDVTPGDQPFILVKTEKVITDGDDIIQVIGNFDRIHKRMSDIPNMPIGTIADDGLIDPLEMYTLIAQVAYTWLIQKHGGEVVDGKLVIS
jgi:hypothetical protein